MASTHPTGPNVPELEPTGFEMSFPDWDYSAFHVDIPDLIDDGPLDEFLRLPIIQEGHVVSAQGSELSLPLYSASPVIPPYSELVTHQPSPPSAASSTAIEDGPLPSASTTTATLGLPSSVNSQSCNSSSPASQPTVQCRRRIDPQEWTKSRGLITQLYQMHTLKKTMEIMTEEHKFDASEKAYKQKVKEWKLVKNLKKCHAKSMFKEANKRRLEEGKKTTFRYRGGAEIANSKLERHARPVASDNSSIGVSQQSCMSWRSDITFFTTGGSLATTVDTMTQPSRQSIPRSEGISDAKERQLVLPSAISSPTERNDFDMIDKLDNIGLGYERNVFHSLLRRVTIYQQSGLNIDKLIAATADTNTYKERALSRSIGESLKNDQPDEAIDYLVRLVASYNKRCGTTCNTSLAIICSLATCVARSFAAQGRHADAEGILDRVLVMFQRHHTANFRPEFDESLPVKLLLAKSLIAQSKWWGLKGLITPALIEAGILCNPESEQVFTLQSWLLLTCTNGLSVDKLGENLAIGILGRTECVSEHFHTTVLLLELLRCRYEEMGEFADMSRILARMDQVLKGGLKQKLPSALTAYAVLTLAWSYIKLQRYDEARYWLVLFKPTFGSQLDLYHLHLVVFKFFLRQQGKLEDPAPFPGEETLNGTSLDETLTLKHPIFAELVKCLNDHGRFTH